MVIRPSYYDACDVSCDVISYVTTCENCIIRILITFQHLCCLDEIDRTSVRLLKELPPTSDVHILFIYRVIQKESAILWEMIVCVILSKKVHMNMGPILNGYRDMVKRKYGPSCTTVPRR